jgi:hypothetical protein
MDVTSQVSRRHAGSDVDGPGTALGGATAVGLVATDCTRSVTLRRKFREASVKID